VSRGGGKTLAAAALLDDAKSPHVALVDLESGKRLQNILNFPDSPPITVAFSPDSKTLLVGCGYRGVDPRKMPVADPKKIGEVRLFTK